MTTALAHRRGGRGLHPGRRDMQQFAEVNRRTLPEYLDHTHVDALIACCTEPDHRLLILLQWRAGLRVSEAIALTVADLTLDGDTPTLRVRLGKGKKPRVVPVHPELAAALRLHIPYVRDREGGRLIVANRSTAWRWVKQACVRATAMGQLAPGRRVGTHTLRHSAARHWLANAVPINFVQRWLGHSSLQTTLIYLEILPDPLGQIARVP